ncbi:stage II sporulation protein P [Bacillus sp. ISL-40]|uniref:stage II sporulation protein P n=1 Tax=unclassified Bacillus (in: firmicutes) TaxID=185979 RepID=UPI001BEB64A7|nr:MULTISPECIES: stage II sporulation protein P [unclassified Bacillus (in: firmicutes)]MBT2696626.1 stage II sporulation protein P [Bacillus sp. ISL-40]MBT2739924.1 stage II sporulation protein P [Bacillus sp. ISL-77]
MRNEDPIMVYINLKTIYFTIFLLIFCIVFILNFSGIKNKFTSDFLYSTSVNLPTEFFLNLMSNEIALLDASDMKISKNNDQKMPSVSKIITMSVFDIWHKDIRTFFGNEIPGFREFNTEIAVAGIGTNLTNLPFESAPPVEILLKEKEMAEKELADSDKSTSNPPPIKTGKEVVFIYHSHSWESFLPQLNGVKNPNEAVSFNQNKNVIDVGKSLQAELIKKGIVTAHSTTNATEELKKKNWNYNNSYTLSREIVQETMAREKSIQYLIDIHRDSQSKKVTTINIKGKPFARLFFVVGKENQNYDKNLYLAKELNKKLEDRYPGISRGVFVKTKDDGNGVYNQDLSSNSMLLEFGGVDNTKVELDNTIKAFSEVFSEFYRNAQEVNGDSSSEEF